MPTRDGLVPKRSRLFSHVGVGGLSCLLYRHMDNPLACFTHMDNPQNLMPTQWFCSTKIPIIFAPLYTWTIHQSALHTWTIHKNTCQHDALVPKGSRVFSHVGALPTWKTHWPARHTWTIQKKHVDITLLFQKDPDYFRTWVHVLIISQLVNINWYISKLDPVRDPVGPWPSKSDPIKWYCTGDNKWPPRRPLFPRFLNPSTKGITFWKEKATPSKGVTFYFENKNKRSGGDAPESGVFLSRARGSSRSLPHLSKYCLQQQGRLWSYLLGDTYIITTTTSTTTTTTKTMPSSHLGHAHQHVHVYRRKVVSKSSTRKRTWLRRVRLGMEPSLALFTPSTAVATGMTPNCCLGCLPTMHKGLGSCPDSGATAKACMGRKFRAYLRHRGSASVALKTTPFLGAPRHTTNIKTPWTPRKPWTPRNNMNTKEYHEYQGYHTRNTINIRNTMNTTEYHEHQGYHAYQGIPWTPRISWTPRIPWTPNQSKSKQCKAMQINARKSKAMQSKSIQSKARRSKAMQCKAKQSKVKQSKAKQRYARQSNIIT